MLAAPAFRYGHAGVFRAAALLGLPLAWVGQAALQAAQPLCQTRSAAAAASVGIASVAEGCALAVSGGTGRLLLPRLAGQGATCALAESGVP